LLIEINVVRHDVLPALLAPPISVHAAAPPENPLSLHGQWRNCPFSWLAMAIWAFKKFLHQLVYLLNILHWKDMTLPGLG
jgi:hypothetical protein